jgi:hypothetical protein
MFYVLASGAAGKQGKGNHQRSNHAAARRFAALGQDANHTGEVCRQLPLPATPVRREEIARLRRLAARVVFFFQFLSDFYRPKN